MTIITVALLIVYLPIGAIGVLGVWDLWSLRRRGCCEHCTGFCSQSRQKLPRARLLR